MKICPDDWGCPYQATFDSLWEREGIDPGYCEMYQSEPNSKCFPMSKKRKTKKQDKEPKEGANEKAGTR